VSEPYVPAEHVEEIEVDAEPDEAGCGDDTDRPVELVGPLDEPPCEEIEVPS